MSMFVMSSLDVLRKQGTVSVFLTGDEFVWSIPVGEFSEFSQDLGRFLRLRLQIGRDGVIHCKHVNYTV